MHGTSTHLLWADGETYTIEAKPVVTEDTMAEELLAAALENGGASWTTIRDSRNVRGKAVDLAKVRDRLITEGRLINTAARDGQFNLWHHDDPASPRSHAGTGWERLPLASPVAGVEADPFPVPSIERNGRNGNGTTEPELPPLDDETLDAIAAELEDLA